MNEAADGYMNANDAISHREQSSNTAYNKSFQAEENNRMTELPVVGDKLEVYWPWNSTHYPAVV